MKFLSVCSGIEAASVAWKPLGWQCVGVAEIEKFPSLVLADHYGAGRPIHMPDPDEAGLKPKDRKARLAAIKAVASMPEYTGIPNYGDFTQIDPATVGSVDALVGGTPCQAFSVAGARQSLSDARGNLTLSFVRLAHELADNNGLRLVVWENVPGVLSTKDNAFGCFLGGLVGSNEPIVCDKRWPNAGMVAGPKGKAAWIVRDAQYFGLAQRRRRVFVVASFRDGIDPAAILFERKGLQGDIAPSRQAREDLAPTISARTKGGGGLGTDAELDGALLPCWWDGGQVSQTLDAVLSKGQCMPEKNRFPAVLVPQEQVCVTVPVTHTLKADGFDASEDGTGRGQPIVAQAVALRGRDGGATAELGDDKAFTLRASGGGGGGGDKSHVLAFTSKDYGADAGPLAPTLRAGGHTTSHANGGVGPAVCYAIQERAVSENLENGPQGKGYQPHIAYTMEARNKVQATAYGSAVRRLTPRECERLQGFPDDYTLIVMSKNKVIRPEKLDMDYIKYLQRGGVRSFEECCGAAADGPRYKALGNSMAVPVMAWIGRRIHNHIAANDNTQEAKIAA